MTGVIARRGVLLIVASITSTTGFVQHPTPFVVCPTPSNQKCLQRPHHDIVTTSSTTKVGPLFMSDSSVKDITNDSEDRMEKSLDAVRRNLSSIRTGRANAAMLDRVVVDYYGVPTPLNQMATISVPSAQTLNIDPYDKSIAGDIERAIIDGNLGISPTNDGNTIRLNIPPLTEDRRKDLLKQCKALGEEGKVAVRNVRRDGVDSVKKMEKNGDLGKDEAADVRDAIQKTTDKFIKEIDSAVAAKEKEVMTV